MPRADTGATRGDATKFGRGSRWLGWTTALVLGAACVGLLNRCGPATGLGGGAAGGNAAETASAPRVVTLSPMMTQWVRALGHREALVGVSDGDAFAPDAARAVGTFLAVDTERLRSLKPDVVLTATAAADLPPALVRDARAGAFALRAFAYPASVDEALQVGRGVAAALGDSKRAGGAVGVSADPDAVAARLDAVAGAVAGRAPVRALLLFATQPPRACGVGTVHDELLTRAGGRNVLTAADGSAPVLDAERLRALAPEVVLLMRPGAAPLVAVGPADPRRRAVAAAGADRVVLLTDPAVLLAGPTMDLTLVSMAVALHPDAAADVAAAYARTSGLPAADDAGPGRRAVVAAEGEGMGGGR